MLGRRLWPFSSSAPRQARDSPGGGSATRQCSSALWRGQESGSFPLLQVNGVVGDVRSSHELGVPSQSGVHVADGVA